MAECEKFYIVMRAHTWQSVETDAGTLQQPDEGPVRFLPVFENYSKAVAWACPDDDIVEMKVKEA